MNILSRSLTDSFNELNFLVIHKMEAHDMYVSTASHEIFKSGPHVRVSNFAGSGNVSYDTLYQYLSALSDHYGTERNVKHSSQLTFDFGRLAPVITAETILSDKPEDRTLLRLLSAENHFGFQTLQQGIYNDTCGPIVWIDKKLPKVANQVRDFQNSFMNFAYEVV